MQNTYKVNVGGWCYCSQGKIRKWADNSKKRAGPPEVSPREQHLRVRLRGGRTGRRAVMCERLAVAGTTRPFDTEIWYGDRIAVLGANGSGKSSFLRLLAGEPL